MDGHDAGRAGRRAEGLGVGQAGVTSWRIWADSLDAGRASSETRVDGQDTGRVGWKTLEYGLRAGQAGRRTLADVQDAELTFLAELVGDQADGGEVRQAKEESPEVP